MESKIIDFFFNYSNYFLHFYIGTLFFILFLYYFIPKDIKHCFPVHWSLLTMQNFLFAYIIILVGSSYPKSIPSNARYNIIFENNSAKITDLLLSQNKIIKCNTTNSMCYKKIKNEYSSTRNISSE